MAMTDSWKIFSLSDIFVVDYGNKFDLYKMQETDYTDIAFVSRTAANNGISAYVEEIEGIEPYPAGYMTIALGGSIGSTFVQSKPFYTGQNVAVLKPIQDVSSFVKLFIATIIRKESEIRFVAFGRELNKHIKTDFTLKLPQDKKGEPDYVFMQKFIENLNVAIASTKNDLPCQIVDTGAWHSFRIDKIFTHFESGKANSTSVNDGIDCLYLGAKKKGNGVMKKCAYNPDLAHKGNCIVFICNGEGSVGYTNYMDREFIATTDLEMGYSDNLNKYNAMFLVAVIDRERPKFSFGRKWRPHLKETLIKLPAIIGENGGYIPDWGYMERYIKMLPYGDTI